MKAAGKVTLALVIASFVVGVFLLIVTGSGGNFVEIPFVVALALGPSALLLLGWGGIVAWLIYTPFTVMFAFLAVYHRHSRDAKYFFWALFGLSWMFWGACYWGIPV